MYIPVDGSALELRRAFIYMQTMQFSDPATHDYNQLENNNM